MSEKNILDEFFDRADEVLDKASILRKIGTPEEEEARTNPPLIEWKFVAKSRMWHAFRIGTDETRCGKEFDDDEVREPPVKGPGMALVRTVPDNGSMSVMCCIICMIRTVR